MKVKWDLTGTWLGPDWDFSGTVSKSHFHPTSVPLQFHFSLTSVLLQSDTPYFSSVSIQDTNMITFCQHQCPFSSLFSSVLFSFHLELQWHSLYVERVMKAEIILFRLGRNPPSYVFNCWSIRSQVNNSMHIYHVDWLLQYRSTSWDSPLPWDTSQGLTDHNLIQTQI